MVAYVVIGILAGVVMGFFGLAGGIIIIPGLTLLAHYSQKLATGTYLFVLLLPTSLISAMQYYKSGDVDLKAAFVIGIIMSVIAWFCTKYALKLDDNILRFYFGIFVIIMGLYIMITAKLK